MTRCLQLETTRIRASYWINEHLRPVTGGTHVVCMSACSTKDLHSREGNRMMLLVLFPFAEVLFSGFTCVYLCGWPHVYTFVCVCAYWEHTCSLATGWTWGDGAAGSFTSVRLPGLATPTNTSLLLQAGGNFCLRKKLKCSLCVAVKFFTSYTVPCSRIPYQQK